MPELPKKLPAKGISILFGVSETRISQMKRKGLLKPDSDNMYDVQQCLAARGFQISQHGAQVVAQEYGNRHGKISPAKVTALNTAALSPEDREALGIDDSADVIQIDPAQIAPSPNSQFVAQTRLSELREQKLQAELDRARTRAEKERGELIERAEILTSFIEAGASIAAVLQSLPAEIASIFADPDKKAEVRLKVQTRVDQAQHLLYKAIKDAGQDVPDEPTV